jgi:hypothetical protein
MWYANTRYPSGTLLTHKLGCDARCRAAVSDLLPYLVLIYSHFMSHSASHCSGSDGR